MQPHQYVKGLQKRKRQATRSLFIGILVAAWICIFLFGQRKRIIETHESLVESADESFLRYQRFAALRQHSIALYEFCITQGLIHRYGFEGKDAHKSLGYARDYVDIMDQRALAELEVPFYMDALESGDKIRSAQPQIKKLASWMHHTRYRSQAQVDSLSPPLFITADGDTMKLSYWDPFIPLADTTRPPTIDLLEWVYASSSDITEGTLEINTSTDFTSTQAFRGRHFEHHEKTFLERKALLDSSWNDIALFLKEQWIKFDLQTADPENQRISGSFSEVQLYGFSVNLIFFLYLIGPVIAGLLVWEYSVMQQLHRLNKGRPAAPVWLFEYNRLMKGLPFEKIIIASMTLLEECVRLLGLTVVLYGVLFRFNYLDQRNIPFNFFFEHHAAFQLLDITTLISFGIALLVSTQNFSWNFPKSIKWLNHPLIRLYNWSGLLLPVAVFIATYIWFFDFARSYYATYSIGYLIVLTVFLMILYRAVLKARLSAVYFLLLAALYWAWNGLVLLSIITGESG
ncbi:MAG: hypothetical protein DI535_00700 [Citrobacter freundii]|nr:MAG: hypothetical protein DI535_00700 [Citrobacter freundii]